MFDAHETNEGRLHPGSIRDVKLTCCWAWQTEHNIRLVLDLLWTAGDSTASSQAKAQLTAWLQAWRDATARRKTPSFTRLHAIVDKVEPAAPPQHF